MSSVIPFKIKRPSDIRPYINQHRGWSFDENDKDFLIHYYKKWIEEIKEETDIYTISKLKMTLNSLLSNGVKKSKKLIQSDALFMSWCVGYDIYYYYESEKDFVRFIENSIIVVRW